MYNNINNNIFYYLFFILQVLIPNAPVATAEEIGRTLLTNIKTGVGLENDAKLLSDY